MGNDGNDLPNRREDSTEESDSDNTNLNVRYSADLLSADRERSSVPELNRALVSPVRVWRRLFEIRRVAIDVLHNINFITIQTNAANVKLMRDCLNQVLDRTYELETALVDGLLAAASQDLCIAQKFFNHLGTGPAPVSEAEGVSPRSGDDLSLLGAHGVCATGITSQTTNGSLSNFDMFQSSRIHSDNDMPYLDAGMVEYVNRLENTLTTIQNRVLPTNDQPREDSDFRNLPRRKFLRNRNQLGDLISVLEGVKKFDALERAMKVQQDALTMELQTYKLLITRDSQRDERFTRGLVHEVEKLDAELSMNSRVFQLVKYLVILEHRKKNQPQEITGPFHIDPLVPDLQRIYRVIAMPAEFPQMIPESSQLTDESSDSHRKNWDHFERSRGTSSNNEVNIPLVSTPSRSPKANTMGATTRQNIEESAVPIVNLSNGVIGTSRTVPTISCSQVELNSNEEPISVPTDEATVSPGISGPRYGPEDWTIENVFGTLREAQATATIRREMNRPNSNFLQSRPTSGPASRVQQARVKAVTGVIPNGSGSWTSLASSNDGVYSRVNALSSNAVPLASRINRSEITNGIATPAALREATMTLPTRYAASSAARQTASEHSNLSPSAWNLQQHRDVNLNSRVFQNEEAHSAWVEQTLEAARINELRRSLGQNTGFVAMPPSIHTLRNSYRPTVESIYNGIHSHNVLAPEFLDAPHRIQEHRNVVDTNNQWSNSGTVGQDSQYWNSIHEVRNPIERPAPRRYCSNPGVELFHGRPVEQLGADVLYPVPINSGMRVPESVRYCTHGHEPERLLPHATSAHPLHSRVANGPMNVAPERHDPNVLEIDNSQQIVDSLRSVRASVEVLTNLTRTSVEQIEDLRLDYQELEAGIFDIRRSILMLQDYTTFIREFLQHHESAPSVSIQMHASTPSLSDLNDLEEDLSNNNELLEPRDFDDAGAGFSLKDSGAGDEPATSLTSSQNNLMLNNQVAPGNRANNYWDNFKSHSQQNLLSTSKANGPAKGQSPSGSDIQGVTGNHPQEEAAEYPGPSIAPPRRDLRDEQRQSTSGSSINRGSLPAHFVENVGLKNGNTEPKHLPKSRQQSHESFSSDSSTSSSNSKLSRPRHGSPSNIPHNGSGDAVTSKRTVVQPQPEERTSGRTSSANASLLSPLGFENYYEKYVPHHQLYYGIPRDIGASSVDQRRKTESPHVSNVNANITEPTDTASPDIRPSHAENRISMEEAGAGLLFDRASVTQTSNAIALELEHQIANVMNLGSGEDDNLEGRSEALFSAPSGIAANNDGVDGMQVRDESSSIDSLLGENVDFRRLQSLVVDPSVTSEGAEGEDYSGQGHTKNL